MSIVIEISPQSAVHERNFRCMEGRGVIVQPKSVLGMLGSVKGVDCRVREEERDENE